jgi:shikimate dehydrogenase
MRRFGLIGYPLSHSFSKRYFAEKFQTEGITDAEYENYPIASIEEFPALVSSDPDLAGLNVTIPYKEQVIAYLDDKNEVVNSIAACNCIRIQHGRKVGYNTDVVGFERTLIKFLTPVHDNALVLGTGGAAKAVCYVLQQLQIPYLIVSRSTSGGQTIPYEKVSKELVRSHRLIINTTPLGMYPKVETAPSLPFDAVTSDHYFYDLVYNPAKTLFLTKAEEQGAVIQNGEDMLAIQAEESWRIWNQ